MNKEISNSYYNRFDDLKQRLNTYFQELTGENRDFISNLDVPDLFRFKNALSDIHNMLTLKMTFLAVDWLCEYFQVDESVKESILLDINSIKPNTNGFDIKIDAINVIAEVKCVVPINNSNKYGSAQWNAILEDAVKLKFGKGKYIDTSKYFKFLFLVSLGEKTEQAILHMLNPSVARVNNPLQIRRYNVKAHIKLLGEHENPAELSLETIYIKPIEPLNDNF